MEAYRRRRRLTAAVPGTTLMPVPYTVYVHTYDKGIHPALSFHYRRPRALDEVTWSAAEAGVAMGNQITIS